MMGFQLPSQPVNAEIRVVFPAFSRRRAVPPKRHEPSSCRLGGDDGVAGFRYLKCLVTSSPYTPYIVDIWLVVLKIFGIFTEMIQVDEHMFSDGLVQPPTRKYTTLEGQLFHPILAQTGKKAHFPVLSKLPANAHQD